MSYPSFKEGAVCGRVDWPMSQPITLCCCGCSLLVPSASFPEMSSQFGDHTDSYTHVLWPPCLRAENETWSGGNMKQMMKHFLFSEQTVWWVERLIGCLICLYESLWERSGVLSVDSPWVNKALWSLSVEGASHSGQSQDSLEAEISFLCFSSSCSFRFRGDSCCRLTCWITSQDVNEQQLHRVSDAHTDVANLYVRTCSGKPKCPKPC